MTRAGLTEYMTLVRAEREARPAEAMLVDEIDRLRAQVAEMAKETWRA